jgi:N-acetylmuramoyl-L-alanine amidase
MKIIIAIIINFFLFYPLTILAASNAETKKEPLEVIVKTGVHNGFIRIVFSMPEHQVNEAFVDQIDNTIKIKLNTYVYFKLLKGKQEENYIRISSPIKLIDGLIIEPKKDGCILKMEGPGHMKTLKLFNPSRLVVDIYFSESIPEGEKKPRYNVIMIDPGHGGYDKGITSESFLEKNFLLTFSKSFAAKAERLGKKIIFLRSGDYAISMKDRIKTINKTKPDILISFHISLKDEFVIYLAGMRKKDKLYQFRRESELISRSIMANIKNLGIKVKSQKIDSIISAYVDVPAIFIELPNPEKFTYDKKMNQKIIEAILNSLETEGLIQENIKRF